MTTAVVLPQAVFAASLADSVSHALSTHPAVVARTAAAESEWDNMREQKSAYWPVLGINSQFGRTYDNNDTTRAATGGDGASSWKGQGSVSVTQPIFNGFTTSNRVKAAKERHLSAEYDIKDAADNVALQAARAHLNLMRTRELLDIATSYLREIEARKENINLMLTEGAAEESELLQADEILMAARTTRLGYEEAYRQAEADYIQAVGEKPVDRLDFGQPTWDRHIPQTIDQAAQIATEGNPRIQAAEKLVSALGREAQAERGGYYPRLDAEVSATAMDQHEDLGGELENVQGMLKMSWNFSTGGGLGARVEKQLDARREAQARHDEARREVEHGVRQKFTSMAIVDQQFKLLNDRETAATKLLENYKAQFEGGKQTNLQLVNATMRLFEAKAGRADAFYRRLLSRFELLDAMGSLRTAFGLTPDKK
jgi:TolC family type I secretion outer membrane protein